MRHLSTTGLVFALLLNTFAIAQPPEQQRYYPTKAGAKWVYQEGDKEITMVATAVEEKDGASLVTITEQRPESDPPRYKKVLVAKNGLFLRESGGSVIKVAHEDCLLKLPHAAGRTWKEVPATPTERGTYTAHGPELVEVPAGKYQAIRVVLEYDGMPPLRVTTWYAPDVGLVKWAVGDKAQVLKSYTPPRK